MDNEEYIRVGTCYLKLCRVPTATGEFREKYLPWNIETIRQDHSKDFVANIKKYDGYCFFPAHVDYQRMYGNFLNMYEPIPYHPEPGEFPHIRAFLAHSELKLLRKSSFVLTVMLAPKMAFSRWIKVVLPVLRSRETSNRIGNRWRGRR